MNKLHYLRTNIGASVKDIERYTGICASTIFYLENEKRPFRQIHLDKLTSFFNVTSDYLLGRSNKGLLVFIEEEDEPTLLTENEFQKLNSKISTDVIKRTPIKVTITGKEEISINETPYVVHRELSGKLSDYDLKESMQTKLAEIARKMTTDELNRTIKFIEEYILNN